MSTRACYVFKDNWGEYGVYVHHDGYPTGAANKLLHLALKKLAWELPRWEADEFAAAFVAANKEGAGGVRLLTSASYEAMPTDIEYLYVMETFANDHMSLEKGNYLRIKAYEVNFPWNEDLKKGIEHMKLLFDCPYKDLEFVADAYEKNQTAA